ncbi:MAG TPA: methyltransferase domain-containing protein [Terracidiphilus sp.]|jgi:ubiquinone/menaquinone biosynthesis C-methylase UbiE|nr:methyltransferase domain-containing protein [Terracidiphilus sp.]
MDEREEFYERIVQERLQSRTSSILVCGGGAVDKCIFERLGFCNVTISNLDTRVGPSDFAPFEWKFEDAENLSFADNYFDYSVIHAAVHHASSPHRVITEMYRVSRKGILVFEGRDSIVMRLMEKLQLAQIYEPAAVYLNDCKFGGVNNTEIPNFVYRWTEREVEKTIQSYAPLYNHNIRYSYGSALPSTPELEQKSGLKRVLINVLRPAYFVFTKVFVKQQNQFAFFIEKPHSLTALFPWLTRGENQGEITFNKEWGDRKFRH